MFAKYFLLPALAAIGGLFLSSETAMAQRGGHGGHSSGGHASVSHAGVSHAGVSHASPGRGGYGYGRGGYANGRGGYGYGRGGYGYGGGFWGDFGWWPGYYGYWPGYDYDPAYYGPPAYTDYYGPDVTPYVNPVPTRVLAAADIRVMVPDPAARVWFDGALTHQTGTDRMFHSAPMTAAGTYHIKAAWMQDGQEVTQERDIAVSPGQAVMVDFVHSPVSAPH